MPPGSHPHHHHNLFYHVQVSAGTQGRLVQLVTREEGTAARQGPKPRWARRQDPPPPAEVTAGARRLRQAQEAALRRWTRPDATSTTVFPPGHEDGACVGTGPPRIGAFAAVVMVTFDRAEYLARALESMLHVHALDPDNQCVGSGERAGCAGKGELCVGVRGGVEGATRGIKETALSPSPCMAGRPGFRKIPSTTGRCDAVARLLARVQVALSPVHQPGLGCSWRPGGHRAASGQAAIPAGGQEGVDRC